MLLHMSWCGHAMAIPAWISPVVFGATAIRDGVAMLWRALALSLRSLRPFLLDSRQLRRHSVRMPCQFTLLASTTLLCSRLFQFTFFFNVAAMDVCLRVLYSMFSVFGL